MKTVKARCHAEPAALDVVSDQDDTEALLLLVEFSEESKQEAAERRAEQAHVDTAQPEVEEAPKNFSTGQQKVKRRKAALTKTKIEVDQGKSTEIKNQIETTSTSEVNTGPHAGR